MQTIDKLLGRLDPTNVGKLVQAAREGRVATSGIIEAVRNEISELYTSVATSDGSRLRDILATDVPAELRRLGLQLERIGGVAPMLQESARIGNLRQQLNAAEAQLKAAKSELENVREAMQREIDGLTTQLELAELAEGKKEEEDTDEPKQYLTDNPRMLYITQIAWRHAVALVLEWRKTLKPGEPEVAADFVDWLNARRIEDPGATAVMKLLQHATDFDLDWIDPQAIFGKTTPEQTRDLLRAATRASLRAGSSDDETLAVSDVKREPTMTHVVFSHDAWPAVIASLRAFNADNWAADPIVYLRWLNADDKRRQLLALLSSGGPPDEEALLRDLSDSSREYFDRVVQEASDQLMENHYDFVPVPLTWVKAQVKDVLRVVDEELPRLTATISADQLQDAKVYQQALQRLREIRKQLAIDWLGRLPRSALTLLVDDAMVNDTDDNRAAVVEAFDRMLNQLSSERLVQSVRWII